MSQIFKLNRTGCIMLDKDAGGVDWSENTRTSYMQQHCKKGSLFVVMRTMICVEGPESRTPTAQMT